MLTYGSLFSGIGGLDLGLDRAGMTCKWQVEIDDYATKVLERHWPNVRRWRDIGDFIADAEQVGRPTRSGIEGDEAGAKRRGSQPFGGFQIDLICGGFPCQPVSVAGARRGASDERWLWNEFREVIRIIRPRYVLAENVPGLFSAKDAAGRRGGLFGGVVRDMARLGYDAEWGVLPAASFGAPHLRKRVFIVAHSTTSRFAEPGDAAGGEGRSNSGGQRWGVSVDQPGNDGNDGTAADADETGCEQQRGAEPRAEEYAAAQFGGWWSVEPTICRGDNGVPNRVDRLRCLGNAVVPQVAQWLGERIIEFDAGE
jgi:DNA (cytosine-5)-methyltransferase 1